MSPEDDLQTERIPAIDDLPKNRSWKPILQTEKTRPFFDPWLPGS